MTKKESIKKLKFYDNWFKILGISLLFIIILNLVQNQANILWDVFFIILIIPFILSVAVISWGMIYHQFKRDQWGWFIFTLVLGILFGLAIIFATIYYWTIMRKEFKKGKGIYD